MGQRQQQGHEQEEEVKTLREVVASQVKFFFKTVNVQAPYVMMMMRANNNKVVIAPTQNTTTMTRKRLSPPPPLIAQHNTTTVLNWLPLPPPPPPLVGRPRLSSASWPRHRRRRWSSHPFPLVVVGSEGIPPAGGVRCLRLVAVGEGGDAAGVEGAAGAGGGDCGGGERLGWWLVVVVVGGRR